ncbi:hypothetical protein AVEN_59230-1 [Araneus ventricosus]|uniref:Ciliary microtubule inner protein 2A-C-like domain-containing protein n=1 Tax=Araneus ventricosus TaxID=182803 RepID=A0A4Y2CXS7_ARAVE|nr:hypothetical protein AVEN_59230-1 [Araneus ventricosus]
MNNSIVCPENPIKQHGDGNHVRKHGRDHRPEDHQVRQLIVPPQPYFVPGYTGCTPGAGPQRLFVIGDSYGQYTHELLHGHRVAGSRLNPLNSDLRFVDLFVSPPRQNPKQQLDNPHKSLDPYFIPGYTGFTPGSGVRRTDGVGEKYGMMTHVRLAKHPMAGRRLRPIYKEPPEYVADREEVKFYCNHHEITARDLLRRHGQVPGYTGHMPRARFHHGKTGAEIGDIAIAEFEKIMEIKK